MIASKHEILCTEILNAKYKVREGWLNSGTIQKAFPIWKGIEKARDVLSRGACYMIGNGQKVRVWEDPWMPWLENFKPPPKVGVSQ